MTRRSILVLASVVCALAYVAFPFVYAYFGTGNAYFFYRNGDASRFLAKSPFLPAVGRLWGVEHARTR